MSRRASSRRRGNSSRPRRSSSRPRRWPRVLAIVGGVALVVLLLSVVPTLVAGRLMLSGKDALTSGQAALLEGDIPKAKTSFDQAHEAFSKASGGLNGALMKAGGFVPVLGDTPDAIGSMARSGASISEAGQAFTEGLAALPDGMESLAPRGGRIPLEALEKIAPSVARARAAIDQAEAEADATPRGFVVGPVSDASRTLAGALDRAAPLVRSADELIGALPTFAGKDGAKRYFVAAQNPAEARGAGGLIGVYSILEIRDGQLLLGPFRDIKTLDNLEPGDIKVPSKQLEELYGSNVSTDWVATNAVPDVPTAAAMLEALWKRTQGSDLDGVIYLDPLTLEYLLQATGPVRSLALGQTLTADSVVDYVANGAYFQYDQDSESRKDALGDAAKAVWTQFLRTAAPQAALRSIIEAAGDGHIMVHATDPEVQAAFEAAGITGSLRPDGGDVIAFTSNNAAGSKIDYYMSHELTYDITLFPDETATASFRAALHNDAPKGAKPGYALGPYALGIASPIKLGPGDNLEIYALYCAPGCHLQAATLDDKAASINPQVEQDLNVFTSTVLLRPQQTRTLGYDLALEKAWSKEGPAGIYRLRLLGRPTIQPVKATVTVHAPEDKRFIPPSDETIVLSEEGRTATWTGELRKQQTIELEFERPIMSRFWDFLQQPAIRF